MNSSTQPLDSLRAFRDSLYRCFERRADALFELTDALLTAGPVPSPPHLSLAPVFRRGWGSLYAALSSGRIDEASLQDLLSRHPLEGGEPGFPPIYAVDVLVWPRCDAEASPERGYYYHPAPSLIALRASRNDRVHGFAQSCAFPEQFPIGVLA
jgi:hypothetical protein